MSPQQLPSPRGNKKTLVIGFDFGTHSTKVVLRERGKADGRIARLDESVSGYPPFASPSVIRQVGDTLLFGTAALRASGGPLLSSLKVSLLSKANRNAVALSGRLNNETLVAAYFAWAFQQLRNTFASEEYSNEFLNVAAPMDHIEDARLKSKYLRIVHAAWQLTFEAHTSPIRQGISVSELSDLLGPLMAAPVPGPQERRFDVLPETIAPVVSLSLDPYMKPCIYAIVDMGAGTTEMSVFHAGDPGADQKVLCYKDKTILLGSNDLQLAVQTNGKADAIVARLEREYHRIWEHGYNIDAANPLSKRRWKNLTLVLSGGGTRHSVVANRLSATNPVPQWPDYKTSYDVCRHAPGTLELAHGMSKDDASMFAVANGLSIERKKWPEVFEPHEIEPLTAPEPPKPRPDWGDTEYRPRWV